MAEPGGGAGDLAAIGAAIMAGKPESIRRAATVFGDTTKNYGDAHEAYLTDTKKLMQTWEGAGADAYLDVANRTLGFIETTQQTISPDEAALNEAADALEEAQRAITEYLAKAQQYRDEMAANAQDPDEAALTAEGQRILDALAKAYQAAGVELKPIDNVDQKVGQNTVDSPKKLDVEVDTGGTVDTGGAGDGPNAPPAGDTAPGAPTAPPPGDAALPDGASVPDAMLLSGAPPPGGVVPHGESLVFGAPGGQLGGSLAPSGMLLLSTPDGGTVGYPADPPSPDVPVVPGIGSSYGTDQTIDAGPGGVFAGAVFLGVGNPGGPGPGGHSSTACSDPSCVDPSHGFEQGHLSVSSIGGEFEVAPAVVGTPAPSPPPVGVPAGDYLLVGGIPPGGAVPPALSTPGTTLNTFGSSPNPAAMVVAPPAVTAAEAAGGAGYAGLYPPMAGMPAAPEGGVGTSLTGARLANSRFPGGAGPDLPAGEPGWRAGQPAGSGRQVPEVPVAPFEPGGALAGYGGARAPGQGGMQVLGGDDWDDAEAVSQAIGRPPVGTGGAPKTFDRTEML